MANSSKNKKSNTKNFGDVNKQRLAYAIVILIFIIAILVFIVLLISKKIQTTSSEEGMAEVTANSSAEQAIKESNMDKLQDMSEQERITFYCAEFFKLVDNAQYEKAYEILYEEYKDNYFPTEASFEAYMKEYFPSDFSLEYTNMERLGDIYVLWISVSDNVNGSTYGHNFSMNVVIREDGYDEFVLSFSRDSAVDDETEDDEEDDSNYEYTEEVE